MTAARAGIKKTAAFFRSLGLAGSLKEIGVENKSLQEMAEKAVSSRGLGAFKTLHYQDVLEILQAAYEGAEL